jgi:hypothetical protein
MVFETISAGEAPGGLAKRLGLLTGSVETTEIPCELVEVKVSKEVLR